VLPRSGPSSVPRRLMARLQLIPALLAVTWIIVAAVRFDQTHATGRGSTGFWATATLSLLALLYLLYAGIRRRAATTRAIDHAYRAVARLEQITDVALSDLPTEDLLATLIERVCDSLDADAGLLLMLTAGRDELEVRATHGIAAEVEIGARVNQNEGLSGLVASRATAVALSDVGEEAFAGAALHGRLASAAGAPLLNDGIVSGVLIIGSTTPLEYDDEAVKLLQLAADRCAKAIESNRLREAERRLNLGREHSQRHLRLLVDASRIIIESVNDHEAGLTHLVERATRDFAGFGAVYLVKDDKLEVLIAQHNLLGPSEEMLGFRELPVDSLTAIKTAMATGRSHLGKRVSTDDVYDQALHEVGVTSYVIVPIRVRGLAFGALVFGTVGDMRGFRPSDLGAAEELGRRAALAVEASLLYQQAHDSAELAESYATRLRNLVNAWLVISSSLDRPSGLRTAADGARRVLEAEQAFVFVGGECATARPIGATPEPSDAVVTWLSELHRPARHDDADLPAMPADVALALPPTWICAPVSGNAGAPIEGLILVVGKKAAGATASDGFTAEDESLLVLLARMMSTELTNRQLHRATLENEARLAALIDSSPMAIVDLELSGSIRSWNRAAAQLFDWPDTPASGWQAAFEPRVAELVAVLSADATGEGAPATLEFDYVREDGSEKALVLSVSPVLDVVGSVTGLLLVADDETERRQLAAQFHHAQRLESIGRMAGGVAHDFNNLLTIILGYADAILRRTTEDDPLRERIAAISRAGHRGAALTRQLLAVSRRQVVAPIVLRPVDVFNELAGMITRLIGEDVRVHVSSEDDRPIRIDKAQFEQVILNLAANARDAMRGGGDLYLEVQQWSEDPSYVAVRVRDTGIGMDEETLAHCLEPFYTTKERGEGTGLGMAAVYGIVTQSGGEVTVQSRVGEGTCVSLLMPSVNEPLDYAPSVELPTPGSAAQRESGVILLVEDEAELRTMARRLLRERGYVVLQAPSAANALAMLTEYEGELDLLLTDVIMPGMKGPEFARRVSLERHVPVLFMSGYAEDLIDMPPDFPAATSFLAKPFTPDQLLDEVRKVMAVDRARRHPTPGPPPAPVEGPIADGGRSSAREPRLPSSHEEAADRP
jgi:PAS domain S-box-containing protein